MNSNCKSGFLNLNKPAGWTSHDCVAKVRGLLQLKRAGHGGTLDPTATGVLPIALGRATRLLQFLAPDKAYQATIRFGIATETDDLEGKIMVQQPVPDLQLKILQSLLPSFQGTIEQIPPSYSAIQVQGKRLYDLARAGKKVDVPTRKVEIQQLKILDWRPGPFPELDLAIRCGAGTYIRAIARDLGAALQTGGTLTALIRNESSGFQLHDSLTLEELEQQLQANSFQPVVPEVALIHLPTVTLPESLAKRWCQGQRLPWDCSLLGSEAIQVQDNREKFLGVAQLTQEDSFCLLRPKVVFEVPMVQG